MSGNTLAFRRSERDLSVIVSLVGWQFLVTKRVDLPSPFREALMMPWMADFGWLPDLNQLPPLLIFSESCDPICKLLDQPRRSARVLAYLDACERTTAGDRHR